MHTVGRSTARTSQEFLEKSLVSSPDYELNNRRVAQIVPGVGSRE